MTPPRSCVPDASKNPRKRHASGLHRRCHVAEQHNTFSSYRYMISNHRLAHSFPRYRRTHTYRRWCGATTGRLHAPISGSATRNSCRTPHTWRRRAERVELPRTSLVAGPPPAVTFSPSSPPRDPHVPAWHYQHDPLAPLITSSSAL
ncbi:hypothetical protein BV22DRAFT_346245 [Leucogyrophana mollusca]|uniref:Uncharacterized protein n=1 Tax=Leucogyrophana mollusca TaxID=85980 RepID=A0ACB8BLY6_9AGAM|nr:hypothetical protein BV22DRAFT_346245 [Leucogyrophana mollusca]